METAPSAPNLNGWRIVVHDYGGYAFPRDLALWLAMRGADVLHLQCPDVEAPKAAMLTTSHAGALRMEGIGLGKRLPKYDLLRRWRQESRYGKIVGRRIRDFDPHVVLSANTPPAVQRKIADAVNSHGAALICWVQDVFTPGVEAILADAPRPLRAAATAFVRRVEFSVMRQAAGLIVIAPQFLDLLARYGIRHDTTAVIENWCPLSDITPRPRSNPWAKRHGLEDAFVFLYAGTLGKKHDASLLLHLALHMRVRPEARVVVVAHGPGKAALEAEGRSAGLTNLVVMDLQAYQDVPDMLASADVAVTILAPFAGALSVPSKVYTYIAAARPILAALPSGNHAADLITRRTMGISVDPAAPEAFLAAADRLMDDAALRAAMAARQQDYAAQAFDINRIGPDFETMLRRCSAGPEGSSSSAEQVVPDARYICRPKRTATTV